MAYIIYGACHLTHLNTLTADSFESSRSLSLPSALGALKEYFKSVQRVNNPGHSLFGERCHQE